MDTMFSHSRRSKDALETETLGNRIQLSPVTMQFHQDFVWQDLTSQANIIKDQIFNSGMRFQHATRSFKPVIGKQMEQNYRQFGQDVADEIFKQGFAGFREKPDSTLVTKPCVVDPIEYDIYCCWNQFDECKFNFYDRSSGILIPDIWVLCVHPPRKDGRFTSPCARLVTPFICNVILRAQLEQVTMQHTNSTLILSQVSLPPPAVPKAGPGLENQNYVHFTQEGVMANVGIRPSSLSRFSNGADGIGASGVRGRAMDLRDAYRNFLPGQLEPDIQHKYDLLKTMSDVISKNSGMSFSNQTFVKDVMQKNFEAAMITLPPSPTEPHLIYQLQNGHRLDTLRPPDIPPLFEMLTREYRQIVFDVLRVPDESLLQQRRMYSEETDMIADQVEKASLPLARQLQDLLNRILADTFGTGSMLLYLRDQIEDLQSVPLDELLGEDHRDEARRKKGSDTNREVQQAQVEEEEKEEEEELPVQGDTVPRGKKGSQDSVRTKPPPASSTLDDSNGSDWIRKIQELTSSATGSRRIRKSEKALLKLLLAHQMLDDMTAGEEGTHLENISPLEAMDGEAASHPASDHPTDPKKMAERLFQFKKKRQSSAMIEKGQFHKAYAEPPQEALKRIQSLVQYSEQSMENASGVSVHLNFLENVENQRMMKSYVDPQQAVQVVQNLIHVIENLQSQLAAQDQNVFGTGIRKRMKGSRGEAEGRRAPKPGEQEQDILGPDETVQDTFSPTRDVLGGKPHFDPMDVQRDTMMTAHRMLRMNPAPGPEGMDETLLQLKIQDRDSRNVGNFQKLSSRNPARQKQSVQAKATHAIHPSQTTSPRWFESTAKEGEE